MTPPSPLLLTRREIKKHIQTAEIIRTEALIMDSEDLELRYWEGYISGLKVALKEL